MELNHLRYFHEVAKAGSFTAAARKLRVSQSALSKAVALLEARQGQKLLQRSKKGVALTQVGAEVFRVSQGVFAQVQEIESIIKGTQELCEGYLRFGASDHLVNYFLPEYFARLRKDYPKVIPSVFSGTPHEITGQLLTQELEFGLFFTKLSIPGIEYEAIAELDMALVCSPKILDSSPRDASPAFVRKLLDAHGLIGSIKSQYQKHPSQSLFDRVGSDIPVSFESNSQEAQKRMCLAGGGVAYLARFMVEDEIEKGKLNEIRVKDSMRLNLWLATRKGAVLSLPARTALAMLPKAGGKAKK